MADGIILDIEFLNSECVCEIFSSDERCESGMLTISRFTVYRQEVRVAP